MPAFPNHTGRAGVPMVPKSLPAARAPAEVVPIFEERNYAISGVTRDSTGAPLGNCTVKLFNSATDVLAQLTVSDASGNYSFVVDKTQSWYLVEYKAGAPDVAGTSVNTLTGA